MLSKSCVLIATQNGKSIQPCGPLVLYVKSPEIMFNVFALQHDLGDDLAWTYTLVSMDKKVFEEIRAKAQAVWDANQSSIIRGRGFYVNPKIIACAKGQPMSSVLCRQIRKC